MPVSLNDTTAYHRSTGASLGWEQTISECLRDVDSPYQDALRARRAYGDVVADLLQSRAMISDGARVLEVGGGHGNLARSLLSRFETIALTMADISPVFLARQRETLSSFGGRVKFVESDIFDYLPACERF